MSNNVNGIVAMGIGGVGGVLIASAPPAPKRRGRPPGSKNKPKTPVAVVAPFEPSPAPVAIVSPQAVPVPIAALQMASTHPNAPSATKLVKYALAREAAITQDMVNIAFASNGHLEGLESRVKTVESTARKLSDVAGILDPSTSGRVIGSHINDGLRYTMTLPEDAYVSEVQTIINKLQLNGFSITYTKNFWKSGNTYKGLNLDTTRNNLRIEIQFHTPDSYKLKQSKLDALYQKYRVESDSDVRSSLKEKMISASANVSIPNNVAVLGTPIRNLK